MFNDNRKVYESPDVVSFYTNYYDTGKELTPVESFFFRKYLKAGMTVLDIGVGAGRTTPYLARIAGRYVGIDYSEAMIEVCRSRFPSLEFLVVDASDMAIFQDQSFDALIFSANGLDYLYPDAKRHECLSECRRLLKVGGVFIFSVHNPRAILDPRAIVINGPPRPPKTLRRKFEFLFHGGGSLERQRRMVMNRAFWRGDGYMFSPTHGGLTVRMASTHRVKRELMHFGLHCLAVLGSYYPWKVPSYFVSPWYYYVFEKRW